MEPDPITAGAPDIMRHVNEDHESHLLEYLRAFTDIAGATAATMVGVDRDGFDIEAQTATGPVLARITWSMPLTERHQVREEMVRLAAQAQAKLQT